MIIDINIKGHNVMGRSNLSDITSSSRLDVIYDDNISVKTCAAILNELEVHNYTTSQNSFGSIDIKITQASYGVTIIIIDSIFSWLNNPLNAFINSSYTTYGNKISFRNLHFINNHYLWTLLNIQFDLKNVSSSAAVGKHDKVIFRDCLFSGNTNINQIIHCKWLHDLKNVIQSVLIINCLIQNITNCTDILTFTSHFVSDKSIGLAYKVHIHDTDFIYNTCNNERSSTLVNCDSPLLLTGPCIIIHGNTFQLLFTIHDHFLIIFSHTYIEFSENKATYMIQNKTVVLVKNVTVIIRRNVISHLFVTYKIQNTYNIFPMCYFQFFEDQVSFSNTEFNINLANSNLFTNIFKGDAENINCLMLESSLFYR